MCLENLPTDPYELFRDWYAEASGLCPQSSSFFVKLYFSIKKAVRLMISYIYPPISMHQPDAMVLSTVNEFYKPSSRVVLLKEFNETGILFYTNYNSAKGKDLNLNPSVSALFHWGQPERQVRIQGDVEKVSHEVSSAYWKSRLRGRQISGYASPQSKKVESKIWLKDEVRRTEKQFSGKEVPCPGHWGGYLLKVQRVEFWHGEMNRFHDRILYEKVDGRWMISRLAP